MDSLEKQFQTILTSVAEQISGTIGISIIELESGMSLSTLSVAKGLDLEVAAAYNAEVVKQKLKAIKALALVDQEINDFTISLTSQVHIIRFIDARFIMYFAVNGTAVNLAMTKIILNGAANKLKDLVANI